MIFFRCNYTFKKMFNHVFALYPVFPSCLKFNDAMTEPPYNVPVTVKNHIIKLLVPKKGQKSNIYPKFYRKLTTSCTAELILRFCLPNSSIWLFKTSISSRYLFSRPLSFLSCSTFNKSTLFSLSSRRTSNSA